MSVHARLPADPFADGYAPELLAMTTPLGEAEGFRYTWVVIAAAAVVALIIAIVVIILCCSRRRRARVMGASDDYAENPRPKRGRKNKRTKKSKKSKKTKKKKNIKA